MLSRYITTFPVMTYFAMLKVNGNRAMMRNDELSVGEKQWYNRIMWHPHKAICVWESYYPSIFCTSPEKGNWFCCRYLHNLVPGARDNVGGIIGKGHRSDIISMAIQRLQLNPTQGIPHPHRSIIRA